MEETNKSQLGTRQDSGISCFTPSPPPKKSSVHRTYGGSRSGRREPRRRLPSQESVRSDSANESMSAIEPQVLPPKLDLSGLVGSDTESEDQSSSAVSTDRTSKSDEGINPELVRAMESPSMVDRSRNNRTSFSDGYQGDMDYSSGSSAQSICPSPTVMGLNNLRQYGSDGLEDESEGNVMKVKLKIKSSDQGNYDKMKSDYKKSPCHREIGLAKYAPLPGIGHQRTSPSEMASQIAEQPVQCHPGSACLGGGTDDFVDQQEMREQRLRALDRSTSIAEIPTNRRAPVPPPQSANVISRRAMRMQQFARRKSASQAEALNRQKISSRSHSDLEESQAFSSVLLAIRLPSGQRVQNLFKSTDTLKTVASFAIMSGKYNLNINKVSLVTNDMPKKELTNLSMTIEGAGVKDRTLLHLDETE